MLMRTYFCTKKSLRITLEPPLYEFVTQNFLDVNTFFEQNARYKQNLRHMHLQRILF